MNKQRETHEEHVALMEKNKLAAVYGWVGKGKGQWMD